MTAGRWTHALAAAAFPAGARERPVSGPPL